MRTFTLRSGTADKFWQVGVVGDLVTVHFGRTGTKGQVKSTSHESAAKAQTEADKLIASKVRKGYVEGAPGELPAPEPVSAPAPEPVSAPAPEPVSAPAATPASAASLTLPPTCPEPVDGPDSVGEPEPVEGPEPQASPDDLGLRLTRLEEAALSWGRPLDSLQPAGGAFTAASAADWVRRNALKIDDYGAVVLPELPFDGIPAPAEAAWWRAWYVTVVCGEGWGTPSVRDRLRMLPGVLDGSVVPKETRRWPSAERTQVNYFVEFATQLATRPPASIAAAITPETFGATVVPALRALVLPHLTPADRDALAARLATATPTRNLPAGTPRSQVPVQTALLSALLADPAQHEALLEAQPDALLAVNNGSVPVFDWPALITLLVALPSQDSAARMLAKFGSRDPMYVHHAFAELPLLVAAAGVDALVWLADVIDAQTNKSIASAQATILAGHLDGPAAAGFFARLARGSKASAVALDWLGEHPSSLFAGSFATHDEAALELVVRRLADADAAVLDRPTADPTLAGVLAELRRQAAMPLVEVGAEPDWWIDAVAAEAQTPLPDASAKGSLAIPRALPEFASPTMLPPVLADGVRLHPAMVEALVWSAARGANDPGLAARPLVAAVRDRLSAHDRDAIATALLDGWLAVSAPGNQRAFFVGAGFLGADGFVQQLLPMVRDWPGESQHQRAVLGLQVLAATGTKSALQGISGLASKSKFKGIQEAAKVAMDKLAALQRLSADQLADRVVPDGGLDARGRRVLSYGPRQFRITLSPQGKPVVRDLDTDGRPTGKPRTSVPAPNSKDDPEAAAAAKAEFSLLRKQLTDLAKIQTARLDVAMVSGRTWTGAEHREYLAANPVLNSLIRPLVWSVRSGVGADRTLVRVTEDAEYLSIDEDTVELADDAVVALAHPLNLTAEEIGGWSRHLADYDLIAPIQQLDRPTFRLPAGPIGTRLPSALLPTGSIHPGSLVGTVERVGWRRGVPADAGVVNYLWLPFPAQQLAAVLEISNGLWTGMITESGDQRIAAVMVGDLEAVRQLWYVEDQRSAYRPWESVDPVIASETLRTLALLQEKAT